MKTIRLSENHKRALFSALFLTEKLLSELENELLHDNNRITLEINKAEHFDDKTYAEKFKHIKTHIETLFKKYKLEATSFSAQQIINARKAKMWEIISDTKSKKLNNKGAFPEEFAEEFDKDMELLMNLTQNI